MITDRYNIEIAMSATLNSKVVEEIVRKEVEEQTGRSVQGIQVNYDGTKFDGYHVTFKSENTVSSYKSSNEFVEQRWKQLLKKQPLTKKIHFAIILAQ